MTDCCGCGGCCCKEEKDTLEVEGFGVTLEALDMARVGENGNALYMSGKAFGVGMADERFNNRGLGPKYKDPISANRWEKISMIIAARFLSSFTRLL